MSQNKEAMGDEVTIYRSKKLNMLAGVFVIALLFFGLTLPPIISGEQMSYSKLLGLVGFWFFGIFLTLAPLAGLTNPLILDEPKSAGESMASA